MKLQIKNIAILLMLFIINISFADTGEPLFNVKVSDEKTVHFESGAIVSNFIEISIQDEKDLILFSEYTPQVHTFERDYNLEELENGTYFLLIKTDSMTQKLVLTITDDRVNIDLDNLKTI